MSWVFFRHMTLRDKQGNFTYKPRFYLRVASEGIAPFTMEMPSEWHEQANATMALPACGRSVHHVPLRWVLPVLLHRGQREVLTLPEWVSHEVTIHRHCLPSKHLLCTARDLRRSRQSSAIATGFWRAVLLSPSGTAKFSFEAPSWISASFDPTLGFPGEGPSPPPHRPWRFNSAPAILHSASLPSPGSKWRQWALGTLQGMILLHPDHYLTERSAADDVHFCLLALAEAGNSPRPIAARIQSRPPPIGISPR
jgi:hypothetical protein